MPLVFGTAFCVALATAHEAWAQPQPSDRVDCYLPDGSAVAELALPVRTVVLVAADGRRVWADAWLGDAPDAPTIVLGHQALSNAAEYASIAPCLHMAGFDVVALDLRSGGHKFGRNNRTVQAAGENSDFAQARSDIETAVDWVRRRSPQASVLLWGSSYSSSLAVVVAAGRTDVAGLVLFSPAEHLGAGQPVAAAAQQVRIPVFAASIAGTEAELARPILKALAPAETSLFVSPDGAHGASMLRPDRNPFGVQRAWAALWSFLVRWISLPSGGAN